jgi:hypothetical protein
MHIKAEHVEYADKLTRKAFREPLVMHACRHLKQSLPELKTKKLEEIWNMAREKPKYLHPLLEEMAFHAQALWPHNHPNPIKGTYDGIVSTIKASRGLLPEPVINDSAKEAMQELLMEQIPIKERIWVDAR